MHARMQRSPEELDLAKLVEYAREFGLDVATFRQCVEQGKYKEDIRRAVSEAAVKAVRGTPTFVIGRSTASGVEGTLVVGAQPYDRFSI